MTSLVLLWFGSYDNAVVCPPRRSLEPDPGAGESKSPGTQPHRMAQLRVRAFRPTRVNPSKAEARQAYTHPI